MDTNDRKTHRLVERILRGDTGAFRLLINQYQNLVMHIVFRLISNPKDREDICQDVFLKVYQNLDAFRFQAKLSTWIARIAHNRCINFLQKKRVPVFADTFTEEHEMRQPVSHSPSPDRIAENHALSRLLEEEIQKLPATYRTILTLYHLEEMRYQEISRIMDLPQGTVKSYLHRARKHLKKQLLGVYQEEELWNANT
jgi:RNA polymerase sigma-70 factor (ECF subfamily)